MILPDNILDLLTTLTIYTAGFAAARLTPPSGVVSADENFQTNLAQLSSAEATIPERMVGFLWTNSFLVSMRFWLDGKYKVVTFSHPGW